MLTLYGVYRSRASRNLWLLEETGTPFTLVPVIQANRLKAPLAPDAPLNTLSPAYLAMNPAGGVPFLTDGALKLSESLAINLHIARSRGGALGPRDAAEDAVMQQWALYAVASVEPHAIGIMYALRDYGAGTPAATAAIDAMKRNLERPFGVLDGVLAAGGGHLVGGRFTVADINMAECVRYAQSEAAFLAGYPALDAWLKACQARPAFRAMWARRLAEPE
ncbi:MAG: glutathione S-transferase family protein [Rhodobacteraceae bacterium]|nr:glutathione S-transferase family protein [Paracoccaceae bacterium]